MHKTFSNRNHHFTIEQFAQVFAFGEDESMQKKWQAFAKKISITTDFRTVLKSIEFLLSEPFRIVLEDLDQI